MALLKALRETATAGGTAEDCTAQGMYAALQAAIDKRPQADSIGKASDEPPETPLSRMLRDAAQVSHPPAAHAAPPQSPVDMNLISSLTAIERLFTSSAGQARRNAFGLVGDRDFALAVTEQEKPPEIDAPEMLRRIEKIRALISV